MKKGQLVKIKSDMIPPQAPPGYGSDVFVIIKGPYEGIFKKDNHSRLSSVVDLLASDGQIMEKIECIYLERA